jgi:hypothetical protein
VETTSIWEHLSISKINKSMFNSMIMRLIFLIILMRNSLISYSTLYLWLLILLIKCLFRCLKDVKVKIWVNKMKCSLNKIRWKKWMQRKVVVRNRRLIKIKVILFFYLFILKNKNVLRRK